MSIPNILTLSRFFLTCLFGIYAQSGTFAGALAAFLVFLLASLTDWADGFLARKYNCMSVFGKIMDPVADKCLVLTALFIFAFEGLVPLWMVIVIAVREIMVTSSRIHAMTNGHVIAAEKSGKVKTVFQMALIVLVLMYRLLGTSALGQEWVASYEIVWQVLISLFMITAVALTLVSGLSYFQQLKEVKL